MGGITGGLSSAVTNGQQPSHGQGAGENGGAITGDQCTNIQTNGVDPNTQQQFLNAFNQHYDGQADQNGDHQDGEDDEKNSNVTIKSKFDKFLDRN